MLNEARFPSICERRISVTCIRSADAVNTQETRAGAGAGSPFEANRATRAHLQPRHAVLGHAVVDFRGAHYLRLGGSIGQNTSGGDGTEFGSAFVLGQYTVNATSTAPIAALTLADMQQRYQQGASIWGAGQRNQPERSRTLRHFRAVTAIGFVPISRSTLACATTVRRSATARRTSRRASDSAGIRVRIRRLPSAAVGRRLHTYDAGAPTPMRTSRSADRRGFSLTRQHPGRRVSRRASLAPRLPTTRTRRSPHCPPGTSPFVLVKRPTTRNSSTSRS